MQAIVAEINIRDISQAREGKPAQNRQGVVLHRYLSHVSQILKKSFHLIRLII